MIEVIAEHSVEMSLLPPTARILDIGSRGFQFANHFKAWGHEVVTIDADPQVKSSDHDNHYSIAISDFNGYVRLVRSGDAQATRIEKTMNGNNLMVECVTLQSFSEAVKIEFWDLIKIDVEGSELNIIQSMSKPFSRQISCEFHLHTHAYGIVEMSIMENKLRQLGYEPVQHEMTRQHGLGLNFWDSLFILK